MIKLGQIAFKNFKLFIKERPVPNSYLVIFTGGTDVDYSGWEQSAGDRKKLEEDFKFMWNPFDAPTNKKGEYVVKFSTDDRILKFADWLDKQIKEYGGIWDD